MDWGGPVECVLCGKTVPHNETFEAIGGQAICKHCRWMPKVLTAQAEAAAVFCPKCKLPMAFVEDSVVCANGGCILFQYPYNYEVRCQLRK